MTSTLEPLRPPRTEASSKIDSQSGSLRAPIPRELGRVVGSRSGPTLICLGGLHGNEVAGVLGIQRVLSELADRSDSLRGEIVGLTGNRQALEKERRFIDHDLNRAWEASRLERLLKSPGPREVEDQEQLELDAVLQHLIAEAQDRIYLLDIHTTSGPGSAFAILDDTLANREVALDFPVPLVLGLEEELAGTLASYLTRQGVTVLGFEAGQHADPGSVGRAAKAIWLALHSCGLLDNADSASESQGVDSVTLSDAGQRIVEVRYRHPIEAQDGFRMDPGWASFQPVNRDQVVGRSRRGAVRAPMSGQMLMPLYQEQGQDGFFIVQPVRPVWLPVSAVVRRWRLERFLHWLPGVRRHPDLPETFIVDRRYARWLARQLFHLLGFRREGKLDRTLVMTRRRSRPK